MDPTSSHELRPWSWPGLFVWALAVSLWASALIAVTIAAVSTLSTWRHVVHGYEQDAATIAYDEMFPGIPPAPLRSAEDAAKGVALANREYGPALAVQGVIGAALLALAFAYRRRVPPSSRPPRRVWFIVVPLMVVFAAAALLFFAMALGGAMRG